MTRNLDELVQRLEGKYPVGPGDPPEFGYRQFPKSEIPAIQLEAAAAIRELQAENARTTRDRDEWKQAANNALCLAKGNFEHAEAAEAKLAELQARVEELEGAYASMDLMESETNKLRIRAEAAEAKLAELQAQKPMYFLRRIGDGLFESVKPEHAEEVGALTLYAKPVPAVDLAAQELRNIVNAKRFDRESFASDTEFADWVQSRARHILASVPTVDLAEFKREAMRLADEFKNARGRHALRTARPALQSHLDKLGGK